METKKTLSIKDQFYILKDLTCRLGEVHDIQLTQLKMWGLLIPGALKNEVSLDIEKKMVTFKVESKDIKITKKKKEVAKHIVDWVQSILWTEAIVLIKINDKLLWDSRNV